MTAFDRATILLIGSGRLAQHLHFWNSQLQSPNVLLDWDRSQDLKLLNDKLAQVQIVWLAISDSALVSFYDKHLSQKNLTVLHFSGAVYEDRMVSAHPLMSFPKSLLKSEVYSQIHFALTGVTKLYEVMPGFTNGFSLMAAQDKALYHALCVVSGNFPQLLWSETFPKLLQLNIPEAAVHLYIRQITENFIQFKNNALTGPFVRKDLKTIEENSAALTNSKLKKVYQSFAEEFSQ
ncbi:MAG: DUF2520 domain-containing protein [Bdellovibrionaceae bacterium]|nr:DUF2520 domain-containing protein [Bdellovibrio sp.]